MRSKKTKTIALLLAFVLLGELAMVPSLQAQEPASEPQAEFTPERNTLVGEAGRAIFGRVFGIQDQGGDIHYFTYDLSQSTRFNAGFRSFVIPGWGQRFNKQKKKGNALFVTTVAALAGSVILYNKSQDSFDEYQAQGLRNGSKFDDYERQQTQSLILGSLAGLLWAFSIFDAYRNAYNPLWSKERSIQLSAAPNETQVFWRKKF